MSTVEVSLAQWALELKARTEKLYTGLRDALLVSTSQPEITRTALHRLETEAVSIESFELSFLERMGPQAGQISAARANWADIRLQILIGLAQAEMYLGHFKEARAAVASARSVPNVAPDSPTRAGIDFIEASINQMDSNDVTANALPPEEQLALVSQDAVRIRDWRGAAETKMQAAGAAITTGKIGTFLDLSQEAIDLASAHSLSRLEIYCRTLRLQLLLGTAGSRGVLDQIKAELDYTTHLTGLLPARWTEIHDQASQACAQALEALTVPANEGASHRALAAALDTLSGQAFALGLAYESGRLHDAASANSGAGADTASLIESVRQEFARLDAKIRIGLLELAADLKIHLKDPDTAKDIRAEAEQLRGAPPRQANTVFDKQPVQLKEFTDLIQRATEAIGASNPQEALTYAIAGLALADSPSFRRAAISVRAMAYFALGRFAEAEADCIEAISLLESSFGDQLPTIAGTRDHRLTELEALSLLYAHVLAKIGRLTEAWDVGERGRAPALKAEILAAQPGSLADGRFESLRYWLDSIGAAIVSFSPSRYGTLILSAAPGEPAPQAAFADLTHGQLKHLLDPNPIIDIGSQAWTSIIFGAIPELSRRLIAPVEQRLIEITSRARILYLIPYSKLYYAPFAALNLSDGRTLSELCPLALTPSASVLLRSAISPPATSPANCLVAAVGQDPPSGGYAFSRHATQVASAPWSVAPTVLRDTQVTKAALAKAASAYSTLYLSCHGTFSTTITDGLAASELVLAQDDRLNAREILAWKLPSSLVFLNACQSGRFRPEGRTEPNGFMRAFLLAGARSVISTLIHVDPAAAGDLAQAFFCASLAGKPPAVALYEAQLQLKQRGLPVEQWAAHFLTGVGH